MAIKYAPLNRRPIQTYLNLILGPLLALALTASLRLVVYQLTYSPSDISLLNRFTPPIPLTQQEPGPARTAPERIHFVGEYSHSTNLTIPSPPVLNKVPVTSDNIQIIIDNELHHANHIRDWMQSLPTQYPHMKYARANACIFVLCRNSDVDGIMRSMKSFEENVNSELNYPYVMMNDEPFTQEFKDKVAAATKSNVTFGLIAKEHWNVPSNIDTALYEKRLQEMKEAKVIYGDSKSYRLMCRYNSRFFYKEPLLAQYRYYWRMEPDVVYDCKIKTRYDPLLWIALAQKKYAYTIVASEFMNTVQGLWSETMKFLKKEGKSMPTFLRDTFYNEEKNDFNGNHFWSNFEIGDLEFLRSDVYERYMQQLDDSKGFFLERYGDAPVHSLAVGLFLHPRETHYFADLSYSHTNYFTCPVTPTPSFTEFKYLCSCKREGLWIDGTAWGDRLRDVLKITNRLWNE